LPAADNRPFQIFSQFPKLLIDWQNRNHAGNHDRGPPEPAILEASLRQQNHRRFAMKRLLLLCLTLGLAGGGALYASEASAHGRYYKPGGYGHSHYRHSPRLVYPYRGSRIGVTIAAPILLPTWGYYDPWPRTRVVVERQPVVYVQREVPAAQSAPAGYWYYCPDAQAYYPYVQTCPSNWLQVVPQTTP
jgi:hypothetical protein